MKLLLLHPLPLDGSIFADDLRTLVDVSAAPTLYGSGSDLCDWAQAALDSIGDGPIVVVGNSIGGSCAIEVARLAPKKVKALVLVGAKPGHRPEPNLRDDVLRLITSDGVSAAWDRFWLPLFGPAASADAIERAQQVVRKQGADAISNGVRAFHGRIDRESFLECWAGPTLIVSGEHDINLARARLLVESLPNASFHLVAGAGHYIPIEDPEAMRAIAAEAISRAS